MKRVVCMILTLVLTLTLLPVGAQASTGGKLLALTFDDGPSSSYTGKLLDGLKDRGIHVTFFVQGQSAQNNLDLVKRAYSEGHEIASHTWDHPNLSQLSWAEVERQFQRSYEVLDKACGTGTDYLIRPPYGITTDTIRANIDAPLIHWSVDTRDWESLNAYSVRDAILNDSYDGAIVLVHDIHKTSVEGALMALDTLLARGYEFVTVSELYRRRGIALEDGVRYYDCKPNGTDLGAIPTPTITYTTDKVTMEITISADTDAPIYYTTDGTAPNQNSAQYTGPFTVSYPCDIQAVAAYEMNGSRSETAILAFGKTPCDPPTIAVEDGKLVLHHSKEDVELYYTLDGSKATTNSTRYTGPVEIPGDCCVRAVAGGGFYAQSRETSIYCSARGNLFADVVPGTWYFDSIDRLVAMGLMSGVGGNRFEPEEKLTRGMLVALLYRASGETLESGWVKENTFRDVPDGEYYAEAVEWAYRNGIVSGDAPKVFRPEGYITREELCRVIDGYLTHRGQTLPRGSNCNSLFRDGARISSWARSSVEAMVASGLLSGDGKNVYPQGNATRAEVSSILCRMLDYESGNKIEA